MTNDIIKRTEDLDERVSELERKMNIVHDWFVDVMKGLEESTKIDRE